MALIRPRLNDFHRLGFTQDEADFAIPFLDEDIPFCVDPFLLSKSPSLQDQALHTAVISSFNHLGYIARNGREKEATEMLIALSECSEVGLGVARDKRGHRIGEKTAHETLSLFSTLPHVIQGGFRHIEEIQFYIEQIASDRISDITCSLIKSFLMDFTLDQCARYGIPLSPVKLESVFDYRTQTLGSEQIELPINPLASKPILLVPKRWLRHHAWINYDDYFQGVSKSVNSLGPTAHRVAVLNYNRANYGMVQSYIREKERTQADCTNDPLFKPIPVVSAKRKLREIQKLPTGKERNADKLYEDFVSQLLASLLYPQLDFADEQSRTDSGALIRDLVFYNSRSMDFLQDIYKDYDSQQIVFELKNVKEVEREHINQLNRYLADQFGRFGVIVTRNPLPPAIFKNTIDLWSGQRRSIIALTDADLATMVTVFESKQRLPIEVVKRVYLDFIRACPS